MIQWFIPFFARFRTPRKTGLTFWPAVSHRGNLCVISAALCLLKSLASLATNQESNPVPSPGKRTPYHCAITGWVIGDAFEQVQLRVVISPIRTSTASWHSYKRSPCVYLQPLTAVLTRLWPQLVIPQPWPRRINCTWLYDRRQFMWWVTCTWW